MPDFRNYIYRLAEGVIGVQIAGAGFEQICEGGNEACPRRPGAFLSSQYKPTKNPLERTTKPGVTVDHSGEGMTQLGESMYKEGFPIKTPAGWRYDA